MSMVAIATEPLEVQSKGGLAPAFKKSPAVERWRYAHTGPTPPPSLMDEFSDPEPQPSGHLSPPKRRPPTAVGAATPRPPRPSRPRDRLRLPLLSRWARLAVIGLAVGFTAIALAVVQRDPVLSVSALGGALLGVPILYRRWDDLSTQVLAAPFALAIIAGGLVALARVLAAPGEVPGFEGYALPLLSGAVFGYLIGLTLYGIGAAFLVLFLDQLFRKEAPLQRRSSPGA